MRENHPQTSVHISQQRIIIYTVSIKDINRISSFLSWAFEIWFVFYIYELAQSCFNCLLAPIGSGYDIMSPIWPSDYHASTMGCPMVALWRPLSLSPEVWVLSGYVLVRLETTFPSLPYNLSYHMTMSVSWNINGRQARKLWVIPFSCILFIHAKGSGIVMNLNSQ